MPFLMPAMTHIGDRELLKPGSLGLSPVNHIDAPIIATVAAAATTAIICYKAKSVCLYRRADLIRVLP